MDARNLRQHTNSDRNHEITPGPTTILSHESHSEELDIGSGLWIAEIQQRLNKTLDYQNSISSDAWKSFSDLLSGAETMKNEESRRDYLKERLPTLLSYWQKVILLVSTLQAMILARFVLIANGIFSPSLSKAYQWDNSTSIRAILIFQVIGLIFCASFAITSRLKWTKPYFYELAIVNVGVAIICLCAEELYSRTNGPNFNLALAFFVIYSSPALYLRPLIFVCLGGSLLDISLMATRFYTSKYAPNYETNCQVAADPQGAYAPSCSMQLLANTIVFCCFNFLGMVTSFYQHRSSHQQFMSSHRLKSQISQLQKIDDIRNRFALSVLPAQIWNELKREGTSSENINIDSLLRAGSLSRTYDNVTILFGDIVGFTRLSSQMSAVDLVELLDCIFAAFDQIVLDHGLEKLKTIGDCYMICAGVPMAVDDGTIKMLKCALDMNLALEKISKTRGIDLKIRIGCHQGTVIGHIPGIERMIFDVSSAEVEIAALLEHTSSPSKIHVSEVVMKACGFEALFDDGENLLFKAQIIRTYYLRSIAGYGNKRLRLTIAKSPMERYAILGNITGSIATLAKFRSERSSDGLNIITNKFDDAAMEDLFQNQQVQGLAVHTFFSVAMSFVGVALLQVILIIIAPSKFIWISAVLIAAFFVTLLLQMYRTTNIVRNILKSRSASISDTIRSEMYPILYRKIQLVIPTMFMVIHASVLPYIIAGQRGLNISYFAISIIYIHLHSTLYPRIRYYYFVLLVIMFNIVPFVISISMNVNTVLKNNTLETNMIPYMLIVFLLVAWIGRRNERAIRLQFRDSLLIRDVQTQKKAISSNMNDILNKVVPLNVFTRIVNNPGAIIADEINEASVIFIQVELLDSSLTDLERAFQLNRIFVDFDSFLDIFYVEKIKSIGNTYIAMTHSSQMISTSNSASMNNASTNYAERMANFALDVKKVFETAIEEELSLSYQIGLNAGPLVAGVIGRTKLFYDIWGDTVNIASRMETLAENSCIQMTAEMAALLPKAQYISRERGIISVKGKGDMLTFYLESQVCND